MQEPDQMLVINVEKWDIFREIVNMMEINLTLPSSILLYECYIKAGSMCLEIWYYNHYLMWLVLLLLCGHK